MKLPKLYAPLTRLDGFVLWDTDASYDMYVFYYQLPLEKTNLHLFVYVFRKEGYSGAEYVLEHPGTEEQIATQLVEQYHQHARTIVDKRERIKRLFEP